MKTATLTSVLGLSFLLLCVAPAAPHRQRRAGTAFSEGWQQMFQGPLNPKYTRLADLAVRHFTTAVEFYHVVNKVTKVEKKVQGVMKNCVDRIRITSYQTRMGNQYRLSFLYAPTRCSVQDVFEPDRCKAVGAKPTGQCQAVVIVKKHGPFVDWIDCENFDKKAAVQRASKLNSAIHSR